MLNVFMGWDPRETLAYDVACSSIHRRSTKPVLIEPLRLSSLSHLLTREVERQFDGKLWCPISQAPMATEFAISRFCVPFLQKKGFALFCDCDVVATGDLGDLFRLADSNYAVQVVKHQHVPKEGETKMDGVAQTIYPRKNWSSVMLWNCEHEAHQKLTQFKLNALPGRDLHRFCWLQDDEIGELPAAWNNLVGVSEGVEGPGLLHYTLGGPWVKDWQGSTTDWPWLSEFTRMQKHMRARAA